MTTDCIDRIIGYASGTLCGDWTAEQRLEACGAASLNQARHEIAIRAGVGERWQSVTDTGAARYAASWQTPAAQAAIVAAFRQRYGS